MRKPYNKLESELLLIETEGCFMAASAILEEEAEVENYRAFGGWIGDTVTLEDGSKSFDISFE